MHIHNIIEKSEHSIWGKSIRLFINFNTNDCLNISAYPLTKSFSLEFTINDDFEETIRFNICLPLLFSLYISLDSGYFCKKKWFKNLIGYKYGDRITGIRIFDWSIWFQFWLGQDNCGTIGKKWRGYENVFHISDFFLGKIKYSTKLIESGIRTFSIDKGYGYEKSFHKCKWKKELFIRKRPRWFVSSNFRYEVEVAEGVPFPGKGTTSYNCEEDAMYSCSGVYKDETEAINGFINSVIRNRKNYPL